MDNQLNSPRPNYQTNFPPRPAPSPSPPSNTPEKSKKNKNDKAKRILSVLSIVFATIAAFGAGYYIQALSLQSLEKEVDSVRSQNSQLEQQLAGANKEEQEETSENITSHSSELIPANVNTSRDDNRVSVGAIFKRSLNPTEIWVEYGKVPTALDKTTEKNSQELGLGDTNEEYSAVFDFFINSSELEPGATYFYRVGATANGDTRYSSVASFTTVK